MCIDIRSPGFLIMLACGVIATLFGITRQSSMFTQGSDVLAAVASINTGWQGHRGSEDDMKSGLIVSETNRSTVVAEKLNQEYFASQYLWVQFIVEHLCDCSQTFKGDLIELLVLAIIGQSALEGHMTNGSHRPTNATRISDITGIPRETVRRKLLHLEKRGWVSQAAEGGWVMAGGDGRSIVKDELSELDERSRHRVARFYAALEALLKAED